MEKFKNIRVRYNHPAIPPIGIEVGKVYVVGCLIDEFKINISAIKALFAPVEGTWDKLNDKNDKKNKPKHDTGYLDTIDEGVE